jgi:hypothetical protein
MHFWAEWKPLHRGVMASGAGFFAIAGSLGGACSAVARRAEAEAIHTGFVPDGLLRYRSQ